MKETYEEQEPALLLYSPNSGFNEVFD